MRRIDLVLSRLEGVRGRPPGRIAICPSHEDHSPSLSVAEGSDGRVLLFCHAGCSLENIVAALGLKVSGLFTRTKKKALNQRASRRSFRDALADEFGRLLAEGAPATTATMNRVRAKIGRLYGRKLAPLPPWLHEGYPNWEHDPLWALTFRYYADAALRASGSSLSCDDIEQRGGGLPPRVRIYAEEHASRDLHRIARQTEPARRK